MAKHGMTSQRASQIKRIGHTEENNFNALFGGINQINLSGKSADCFIMDEEMRSQICKVLGYKGSEFSVSLKTGKTWQFHLGRIDEISSLEYIKANLQVCYNAKGKPYTKVSHSISSDKQQEVLQSIGFLRKYVGKGDFLCYLEVNGTYNFFLMDDVLAVIRDEVDWRKLESGRIKGDVVLDGKTRKGVFTVEYRDDGHHSLVFGCSGGSGNSANGYRFFRLLQSLVPIWKYTFR